MSKRERMIRNARKELAKREQSSKKKSSKANIEEESDPPSFISGFLLIFFGSITFTFFFSAGNLLVGILASAAFIIIGMSRIFKASAARSSPERMPEV